jgi:hypothetical protein
LLVQVEEAQAHLRAGVVKRAAVAQQADRDPVAPNYRLGEGELRRDIAALSGWRRRLCSWGSGLAAARQ